MPKVIPDSDIEAVFEAVRGFPEGASVEEINCALDMAISRRTLQRRLASLVQQNRLRIEGLGRGCRYYLPSEKNTQPLRSRKTLKLKEALAILTRLKPELVKRYGVTRLGLFGSTVHDKARPESDVDIVVAFDGPATSKKYFGVQFLLEDELGHPVDLVTIKAMRPELQPYIESEVVDV